MKHGLLTTAIVAALVAASSLGFSAGPLEALQQRADAGDIPAQVELGRSYLAGTGITRDVEQGVQWLERAATAHDPNAAWLLAQHFEALPPTAAHRAKMVAFYRQAAVLGHTDAQAALGRMLLASASDARLAPDKQAEARHKGLQLLDHATQAGNAEAAYFLAEAYQQGQGVPADVPRSLEYYERAAAAGHIGAASLLAGRYLHDATSAHHHPERGLRYLRQAADGGVPAAMRELAEHYAAGTAGLAKDEAQARTWAQRAADKGDPDAKELLVALQPKPALAPAPAPPSPSTNIATKGDATPTAPLSNALAASLPAVTASEPPAPKTAAAAGLSFADDHGAVAAQPLTSAADYDGLLTKIGELQQQLNTFQTQVTELRSQLEAKDRTIAALTQERDRAQSVVEGIERELGALQGKQPRRNAIKPPERTATSAPSPQVVKQAEADNAAGLTALKANDYAVARSRFQAAADAGHGSALTNLGMLYMRGQGVEVDMSRAITIFRQAAERGNGVAANNLGYIYQHGMGVTADRGEAIRWYQRAVALGSKVSEAQLRALGVEPERPLVAGTR